MYSRAMPMPNDGDDEEVPLYDDTKDANDPNNFNDFNNEETIRI
jgi:ompA domain protein